MTPSTDIAIRLDGLGLCYRLAKHRPPSLKEYAIHLVRGALQYEKLWALRNIDLEIRRGEAVGVVGRNGAGKSTLLKVLSRVLRATEGRVEVNGFVSPILELGTGFDHELTGYENIYLNALLMGHRRNQIGDKVDRIVDFSGLDDMIHSPIRNYSSGMLARLGFSIATAWPADVLLLDEVLAVGDARFVSRCQERLADFQAANTTILFVSHSLNDIRALCQRVLWIDGGHLVADGPTEEVLQRYFEQKGPERASASESPEPEPATTVTGR